MVLLIFFQPQDFTKTEIYFFNKYVNPKKVTQTYVNSKCIY